METFKINRGTYSNIQANRSSIGANELVIITDKGTPIPTQADVNKMLKVDENGDYELGEYDELTEEDIDEAINSEVINVDITNGTYEGDEILVDTATITLIPNQYYLLPGGIVVEGATLTSYNSTTGEVVLSDPTGEVIVEAVCELMPQLDAPTNLSIDGTVVTFDEVENATRYGVYIDGDSIGTYYVYDYQRDENSLVIDNVPYERDGGSIII